MEAIILAGGKGSRLRSVVADVPKPMALVQGRPFLEWQLRKIEQLGVRRVVISVGWMAEKIMDHFGARYRGLDIVYAHETRPLDTGGAIRLALQEIRVADCAIFNGDSFFDVDFAALAERHVATGAVLSLALKPLRETSRYGTVTLEGERITAFHEKCEQQAGPGLINGGVYLTSPHLFEGLDFPERFSFEKDFLTPQSAQRFFGGLVDDGFFIDIGLPEDYLRAQSEPCFQSPSQT